MSQKEIRVLTDIKEVNTVEELREYANSLTEKQNLKIYCVTITFDDSLILAEDVS